MNNISKWFDRVAEIASEWFGSIPFLLLHLIGWTVWIVTRLDINQLLLVVSLEAIFLEIFILRAANIASRRMENQNKRILNNVKGE